MAKTEDILRDVRVVIGENENIQPLIEMQDDMALERDTLLKTLIAPAIDKVHKLANGKMLRGVTEEITELSWNTNDQYCAFCNIPKDVLFVSYVKAPMWDRAVVDFIEGYTQEYDLCRDSHAGLRPTNHFPAAAIEPADDGGWRLEVYPKTFDVSGSAGEPLNTGVKPAADAAGTGAAPVVRGVKKAKAGKDKEDKETWAIADECYWATIYNIASLYYLSINEAQRAEDMAKEAAEHLNTDR